MTRLRSPLLAPVAVALILAAAVSGVSPRHRGVLASRTEPAAAQHERRPDGTVDTREQKAPPEDFEEARRDATEDGTARVIVGLQTTWTPEGDLPPGEREGQRQRIDRGQDEIRQELKGTAHRVVHAYDTIPFMALELSPEAIDRLERSAKVASIVEDELARPVLAQSVPLVQADDAHAAGLDGSGQAVAILDTGVDRFHAFLGTGRVVNEACFADGETGGGSCPNGLTEQHGAGAAAPCDYDPGCDHGTHVAGIAAGDGTSFDGVAPGAPIIAVQVFSEFTSASACSPSTPPCALSWTSDQIQGLQHVETQAGSRPVASANLSLGGSSLFSGDCDSTNPAYAAQLTNLRSLEVATAIAAGNSGSGSGISSPACHSPAVAVGSTTKSDTVSSFSNSGPNMELWAPGSSINSSIPGGGFGFKSGTSMAAPHVAGAWAVIRQHAPTATVDAVLKALEDTGTLITDSRNGLTFPRINVFPALLELAPADPCVIDDPAEPNDRLERASVAPPGQGVAGVECDDDFYRIYAFAGASLTVNLEFSHAGGNLDLQVLGPTGSVLASSASTNDDETVTVLVAASGWYSARVFSPVSPTENTYTLTMIATTCPPEDPGEPNDSRGAASTLANGEEVAGVACPGDPDWYRLTDASAGDTLVAELLFFHADGDLTLSVWDAGGGSPLATSATTTDNEWLKLVLSGTAPFYLKVETASGDATYLVSDLLG